MRFLCQRASLLALLTLALAAPGHAAAAEARTIVVDPGGMGPSSQRMVLGLNKAAIVQLPEDAADVLVSNPEIVDAVVRTPRRVYILGQKVGQTNAFFFTASGKQLLNLEIRVERDLVDLKDVLARSLPESEIGVEAVNDNVVLKGTVDNAVSADNARQIAARYVGDEKQVVNMLQVQGGEQVMIKVRVAEMQRTAAKQLGVDISALFSAGGANGIPISLITGNPFSLLGQALSEVTKGVIGSHAAGNDVEATIRALERAGIIRTLAEPNLTAVSGESANFLAGGEFPVPTSRDRDGNVAITFKPFGVGLGFTPVVLSEGRISLRISTEVSELTTEGAFFSQGSTVTDSNGNTVTIPGVSIPALRVRRAETTVELPSGGTMVMAGLLQQSTKQNIDGIPGIKDMPVLGPLFRSRDFQNNETELVVIVTPYLVKPVSATQIALPTDGFAPASDAETILLGHLNMVYGDGKERAPEGRLQGPVGFILD